MVKIVENVVKRISSSTCNDYWRHLSVSFTAPILIAPVNFSQFRIRKFETFPDNDRSFTYNV